MLSILSLWNQSPATMNKRIENKIDRWYGRPKDRNNAYIKKVTRIWIAKHYHRWITYGCPMCWIDFCDCGSVLDSPKGFAEMAEYCYDNYGEVWKTR